MDLDLLKKPTAGKHTETKIKLSTGALARLSAAQAYTGQDRSTLLNALIEQHLNLPEKINANR